MATDELDEIWGLPPTDEEIRQAKANNERRLGRLHQAELLLSEMSPHRREGWLKTPRDAFRGQSAMTVLNDLDEDADVVYNEILSAAGEEP